MEQQSQSQPVQQYSSREKLVALILAFFIGNLGAHHFYVGNIGKGILYFFTLGLPSHFDT